MSHSGLRRTIRSVAWPVGFSGSGFLVAFLIKKASPVPISRLEVSIIAFVVTSLCVLLLFPGVLQIPFGKVSIGAFVRRVGLSVPRRVHRHVLLGVVAAFLTLCGMLAGSILSGKWTPSSDTITLAQAVFSLTPGLWEEVLFRGVLMIVLLRMTGSFRKAAVIQILLFGLGHIKGTDLVAFVDAFSVMGLAVAFTYIAYKTRSLIPGVVFHYLHDTFVFFPQLPEGEYSGFRDNALFFGGLWVGTALVVVSVKILAERWSIVSDFDLYGPPEPYSPLAPSAEQLVSSSSSH